MKSFRKHLQEELRKSDFRKVFEEEMLLARLAVQVAESREKRGLTQAQLADRAHLSQQQVSKVENAGSSGFNVNTLLKMCEALDVDLTLSPRKHSSFGKKGATKKAA